MVVGWKPKQPSLCDVLASVPALADNPGANIPEANAANEYVILDESIDRALCRLFAWRPQKPRKLLCKQELYLLTWCSKDDNEGWVFTSLVW